MTTVLGSLVDDQTRCIHYRAAFDIVAIKFRCCNDYYPCHLCHEENAGHHAAQWPIKERNSTAVLCGVCTSELAISEYLVADDCPRCGARFNPGCRLHSQFYFEMEPTREP